MSLNASQYHLLHYSFYFGNSTIFLFYLVSSANLLWCQRCCFLSERTVTHIRQYIPQRDLNLTVCSCHVTYAFQSKSTLYSCLNVKEFLARSRREIWSDCNWTWTQNHLVRKRTLNHLAKLFVYKLSNSGFESSCSHLHLNLSVPLYYHNRVIVELVKNNKEFNCFMLLIIRPSSTFF